MVVVSDRRCRIAAVVRRGSQRVGYGRLHGAESERWAAGQGEAEMINRRELLASLVSSSLLPRIGRIESSLPMRSLPRPLRRADGTIDWPAVRDLFPLTSDWTHLSSFLFVSHSKPVADAIDH